VILWCALTLEVVMGGIIPEKALSNLFSQLREGSFFIGSEVKRVTSEEAILRRPEIAFGY
jgi:hypothetical protein